MPHFNDEQMTILQDERTNDPLARGYSGMTDQQIVDDINDTYRTRNRTSVTGAAFKAQWDETEFSALTEGQKDLLYSMAARDDLDPFGIDAQTVQDIFPGGGTTITTLAAWRVESISRATELGLPEVLIGDVQRTA